MFALLMFRGCFIFKCMDTFGKTAYLRNFLIYYHTYVCGVCCYNKTLVSFWSNTVLRFCSVDYVQLNPCNKLH